MNHYLFKLPLKALLLLCFTVNIAFAQDAFVDNNELFHRNTANHDEVSEPVPSCLPVTNLQHVSSSSTSLGFKWQHYPSIHTISYSYKLLYQGNLVLGKSGTDTIPINCSSSTSCWANKTLSGLEPNKTYTFEVTRNCSTTNSSTVSSIVATTAAPYLNGNDCDTKSVTATGSSNKVAVSITN